MPWKSHMFSWDLGAPAAHGQSLLDPRLRAFTETDQGLQKVWFGLGLEWICISIYPSIHPSIHPSIYYMCVCVCIYIYTYTHTHTRNFMGLNGDFDGSTEDSWIFFNMDLLYLVQLNVWFPRALLGFPVDLLRFTGIWRTGIEPTNITGGAHLVMCVFPKTSQCLNRVELPKTPHFGRFGAWQNTIMYVYIYIIIYIYISIYLG